MYFRVLLSEASAVLNDDMTNPSGSVELLRLTLTKLLLSVSPSSASLPSDLQDDLNADNLSALPVLSDGSVVQVYCYSLQVDNQLYNRASFHFPVLLCQDQRGAVESDGVWSCDTNPFESPEALEEFKRSCFLKLQVNMAVDRTTVEEVMCIKSISIKYNIVIHFYLYFCTISTVCTLNNKADIVKSIK